jgi:hypothetical protein
MRVVPEDDGERLMISTAGVWQASGSSGDDGRCDPARDEAGRRRAALCGAGALTGQNADVRSDVFTMGVLAYEMATATLPFVGASMPALLGAMLRGGRRIPRARSRRCRSRGRRDPEGALAGAGGRDRDGARLRRRG